MFRGLIKALASKSGTGQVAVLIDEFDAPLIPFLGCPEAFDIVRRTMSRFYLRIKTMGEKISFAFITGACRFPGEGPFHANLNNLTDISVNSEFGAMLGFTREELAANFATHVQAAAAALKMDEGSFLEAVKSYCRGVCFDGRARLYNPFSTAMLLK